MHGLKHIRQLTRNDDLFFFSLWGLVARFSRPLTSGGGSAVSVIIIESAMHSALYTVRTPYSSSVQRAPRTQTGSPRPFRIRPMIIDCDGEACAPSFKTKKLVLSCRRGLYVQDGLCMRRRSLRLAAIAITPP